MLTIPMNSVPNALRIAVHNFKADDRASPVPEVKIDNRNYVTRKGISEIGVGFGLSFNDSTEPWLLVWNIIHFIHSAGAGAFVLS
jgi:hypothetical protein